MVYGIYQSAAGLNLNEFRQAVMANNLANVDTPGFKHDLTVIRERQVASVEGLADSSWTDRMLDGMTGGLQAGPTYTSFAQGPITESGRPLDAALAGDGFFRVRDGNTERYTRDGRFTLNRDGELVTVAGQHEVLDEQGRPILVPANLAGRARIESSGEVQSGDTSCGKLGVVTFDDPARLRKIGGNLFEARGAEPQRYAGQLRPGAVEASTVDPTKTMVSMIEVSRSYEMNATLVGLADSTLGRAVNDIARIR